MSVRPIVEAHDLAAQREHRGDGYPEGASVRWKLSVVIATLWLDIVVVAFIVVMVGRVSTPIASWIERMSHVLMMKQ